MSRPFFPSCIDLVLAPMQIFPSDPLRSADETSITPLQKGDSLSLLSEEKAIKLYSPYKITQELLQRCLMYNMAGNRPLSDGFDRARQDS